MKYIVIALVSFSLLITSCKNETPKAASIPDSIPVESITATLDLAKAPDTWVKERVTKAQQRLEATPAGKIIWQAMEAHGGLTNYYKQGPLSFHFDYKPLDGSTRRNTTQTINTWNNTARHQHIEDPSQEFGWTGEKAWKKVKDSTAFPFDMRFWALTPHYFLSQPFILDGEGVNLEKLEDKSFKNEMYDAIKVTFAAGTGDAPDDYYVLYFGKQNHKLAVIRYIVSYPKYFPEGGHLPEKLMELQGTTVVNGIEFSTGYHTHWLTEDEQPGEHITTITVSDITFKPEIEKTYFKIPEGGTEILK